MVDRRYVSRKFLHEGPQATCPCCDNKVEVRIASPLEQPDGRPWVIDEPTLISIYRALKKGTLERTYRGKNVLYVRCAQAILSDHKASGSTKVMFVDLGKGRLAGPFCESCLKTYLRMRERPDGQQTDTQVFVATATHAVLTRLRLVEIESEEQDVDLTDVVDLF